MFELSDVANVRDVCAGCIRVCVSRLLLRRLRSSVVFGRLQYSLLEMHQERGTCQHAKHLASSCCRIRGFRSLIDPFFTPVFSIYSGVSVKITFIFEFTRIWFKLLLRAPSKWGKIC